MRKSVPEQIVDAVFALLPVGTSTLVGAKERESLRGAPPRVVAVLLGSPEISEPRKAGDAGYTDAGRMLYQRGFMIEWDCHAVGNEAQTDFCAAEDLFKALLLAVRNVGHHSMQPRDERWIDQEDGNDGLDRQGALIRFTTIFDLAVYEPRGPVITLTATPPIATTATLNGNVET